MRVSVSKICLLLLAASAAFVLSAPTALASTYGNGAYGECRLQAACPQADPPSQPPSQPPVVIKDPPPAPPKPAYRIKPVGIVDGSTVTVSPVTLRAQVEATDTGSGQPTTSEVGWVNFFVEAAQLPTAYQPSEDGLYSTEWDVQQYAGQKIAIVAYRMNTGEVLARADINVVVTIDGAIAAPSRTPSQPQAQSDQPQTSVITEILDNIVPPALTKTLKELPPVVVYTFPYWLFMILLIITLRVIWQAIREANAADHMRALLARQQFIAEEKDNFIVIASHYLHTPLTIMQNGTDIMISNHQLSETDASTLVTALGGLKQKIDMTLASVESNEALKSIRPFSDYSNVRPVLKSLAFWLPVLLVCILVLVINLLLGTVGRWELGNINLFTQLLAFGAVVVFFFFGLRSHSTKQSQSTHLQRLIEHENAIDTARNNFINDIGAALHEGLAAVAEARKTMPVVEDSRYLDEGYSRFIEILNRLDLLKQIQAGLEIAKETFPMQPLVDKVLEGYAPLIQFKKLTVTSDMHDIQVTGNSQLFSYVLTTVIDNAIKFSSESGRVSINASRESGKIKVTVADNGQGIPADKLPHLFKPFTRAGSVLQFDYEGLGFSLFLDRIIMNYLDGDIDINSKPEQGTLVTVHA